MGRPRKRFVLPTVPAACPRRLEGGAGPRTCVYTACPMHILAPPARGPWRPAQIAPGDDTCSEDVGARHDQNIASMARTVLKVRRQSVQNTLQNALRKLKAIHGMTDAECETLLRRRG